MINIIFSLLETFAVRIARISANEKNKTFTTDLRTKRYKGISRDFPFEETVTLMYSFSENYVKITTTTTVVCCLPQSCAVFPSRVLSSLRDSHPPA
jgi:hypothetical protein